MPPRAGGAAAGGAGVSAGYARRGGLAIAAVLLASGVAALGVHNLRYPGMWWDESAQFWVSQGLSNYSPPFAAPRGWRDVIRSNRYENLDPGGFSLLLHFWTVAGRGLGWLRAFSLAFYVLGTAALGVLGWRLTRSAVFALAAAAAPSLYPAALYFGFEIRAYGMEMAGVAAGALALAWALEKPSPARALLLGLTCAAFVGSRYSFAMVAAALAGAYAVAVLRRGVGAASARRQLVALLLPVCAAAAMAWWVTLRHQLWPDMTAGPLGLSSPAYTRASVLGHGADDIALLWRNLFSLPALPLTACAVHVAFFRRWAYGRLPSMPDAAASGPSRAVFASLHAAILGTQALSAAASLLGLYPWDIASRWSAYLVMLSALAAVLVGAELVALGRGALARSLNGGGPRRLARRIGAAAALLVVAAGWCHAREYRYAVAGPRRTNLAPQIEALPAASLRDSSVLVAFYQVPALRYLYEFGPYAGRGEYPRIFRFETESEWRRQAPFAAAADGIAFVVSAWTIDEARARVPGVRLSPVGPAAGGLLAVAGATGAGGGSPP